jgi:hypothetical protein
VYVSWSFSFFVPQRFPTVRRVIYLGNCEQTTKLAARFSLQIHRMFKHRMNAGHCRDCAVEIGCIMAGKTVQLQWEWCAPLRARPELGCRRRLPGRKCDLGGASLPPVRGRWDGCWGPAHGGRDRRWCSPRPSQLQDLRRCRTACGRASPRQIPPRRERCSERISRRSSQDRLALTVAGLRDAQKLQATAAEQCRMPSL